MIVLNDMPGQLCNRLWSYAPFVAWSYEKRVRLLVPFFVDYADAFPNLGAAPRVHFARLNKPLYLRIARRILRTVRTMPAWLAGLLRLKVDAAKWGQESWDRRTLESKRSIVFLAAWNHPRPVVDLRPHRERLAHLFAIRPGDRAIAEAAIAAIRRRADVVVGVHIRRGDYRTFLNGKYFFETEVYLAAMKSVADQTGKPTAFLLCSNEPLARDHFPDLDVTVISNATAYVDLHALSCCDLIIAAPSTFSLWASFVGEVPLGFVLEPTTAICVANFSPAINLSGLANGTRYTLKEEGDTLVGPWITAQG